MTLEVTQEIRSCWFQKKGSGSCRMCAYHGGGAGLPHLTASAPHTAVGALGLAIREGPPQVLRIQTLPGESVEAGPPLHWVQNAGLLPLGHGGRTSSLRAFLLSPQVYCILPHWVLELFRTCHSFLFYYSSLLEWECPSYACPTIVFWKHITYSQVHSWRRICLRTNCPLSLTHI